MRPNKLRELLRAGTPTLGTRVMSPWPTVIEVLGQARQAGKVARVASPVWPQAVGRTARSGR